MKNSHSHPKELAFVAGDLTLIRQAMRAQDAAQVADQLVGLIGKGRGLTPAGDDVVVGFLLALSRYHGRFDPSGAFASMAGRVPAEAARRTTILSANLIACAGEGEADERLVRGLDCLVGGEFSAKTCAQDFLSYGSTSGGEALLGMALWILNN